MAFIAIFQAFRGGGGAKNYRCYNQFQDFFPKKL